MNGEMEFVLYCSEEGLGRLGILAGVHRRGIDVGDFLIKLPLTCPDFTDFRQQVLKILLAKKCPTLKPLFIQHIAANGIGSALADLTPFKIDAAHPGLGAEMDEGGTQRMHIPLPKPEFLLGQHDDAAALGRFIRQ